MTEQPDVSRTFIPHRHTHTTHRNTAYCSPTASRHTSFEAQHVPRETRRCVSYAQVAAGTEAVATPESGSVHVTVVGVDVAVL